MGIDIVEYSYLQASTAQVFEFCAEHYLKEDVHWGSDTSTLSEYCNPEQAVIDVGCGPGWHVDWFCRQARHPKRVVGIDNCQRMLDLAAKRVCGLQFRPELCLASMRSMPFFNCEFDLAICMNNSLGNVVTGDLPAISRKQALSEIHRILTTDGHLVLSVFARTCLSSNAEYGAVFVLDRNESNIAEGDLIVRYVCPTSTQPHSIPYYSHWFTEGEVYELLVSTGFKDVSITYRGPRLVAIASKG